MKTTTLSRSAIMTIDPGGKTGVAMGWFNLEMESIEACIRRARKRGSFNAYELDGPPLSQAALLFDMYEDFVFKSHVEYSLPYSDIHVVIEDFQLRKQNVDLRPVEITAAFEVFMLEKNTKKQIIKNYKKTDHAIKTRTFRQACVPVIPSRQMPSTAMTYATNQRLRDWGAWVVGSEHARDATRHLCAKLSVLLG